MTTRTQRPAAPPIPTPTPTPAELRRQILEDFATLRIPLRPEQFDAVRLRAEHEGLSHLEFVRLLISGWQLTNSADSSRASSTGVTCFPASL